MDGCNYWQMVVEDSEGLPLDHEAEVANEQESSHSSNFKVENQRSVVDSFRKKNASGNQ